VTVRDGFPIDTSDLQSLCQYSPSRRLHAIMAFRKMSLDY